MNGQKGAFLRKMPQEKWRFQHLHLYEASGTHHKFARCRISTAAVILVCFGLTADSTQAERAELIVIILNVAAAINHIFRCIHNIHIDRWKIGAWVRDKIEQIEETTKKGARTTALPKKESVFHIEHWDKCSWFLGLNGKRGSGRPGPHNVQLTVANNNNKK